MKTCNSCGTKIGFFSKNNYLENNIYCAICYQKHYEEYEKKQEEIKIAEKLILQKRNKEKEHRAFKVYKTISEKIEKEVGFLLDIVLLEKDLDDLPILFFGSVKLNSSKNVLSILNKYERFLRLPGKNLGRQALIEAANDFNNLLFGSVEFFNDDKSIKTQKDIENIELQRLNGLCLGFYTLHKALIKEFHNYLSEEQLLSLKRGDFSYEDMLLFIFNEYCDECKKLSGKFISKKRNDQIEYDIYNYDVNSDICDSDNEQLTDFINKYLSNRNPDQKQAIESLYCDKEITIYLDKYSLSKLRELCDSMMTNIIAKKQSKQSLNEIDESVQNEHLYKLIFDFLDDLGKMQKLFSKKNIKANYLDIHRVFTHLIIDKIQNELKQKSKDLELYVSPLAKRLVTAIGQNYDKGKVKRELYRYYQVFKYLNCFADKQIEDILIIILDRIEFSYTTDELRRMLNDFKNDYGVDVFGQTFGKNESVVMGDFAHLSGYQFEKYLSQLFRYMGYAVYETPLTGDQGADLVLSKSGQKVVVQAKKYSDKVTNKAIQEVFTAKAYYNAEKAIVVTNSSFTDSAIELALSNDVELWDNEKLNKTIKNITIEDDSNTLQSLLASYSITEDGKQRINIFCPLCDGNFDLFIQADNSDMKCPLCEFPIKENMKIKICKETSDFKED